jgi:hypothetical protein
MLLLSATTQSACHTTRDTPLTWENRPPGRSWCVQPWAAGCGRVPQIRPEVVGHPWDAHQPLNARLTRSRAACSPASRHFA